MPIVLKRIKISDHIRRVGLAYRILIISLLWLCPGAFVSGYLVDLLTDIGSDPDIWLLEDARIVIAILGGAVLILGIFLICIAVYGTFAMYILLFARFQSHLYGLMLIAVGVAMFIAYLSEVLGDSLVLRLIDSGLILYCVWTGYRFLAKDRLPMGLMGPPLIALGKGPTPSWTKPWIRESSWPPKLTRKQYKKQINNLNNWQGIVAGICFVLLFVAGDFEVIANSTRFFLLAGLMMFGSWSYIVSKN